MKIERKLTTLANARVKTSATGEPVVTGYASVFGNSDSYSDIVQRGAFLRALKRDGTKRITLWQHNADEPIGYGVFSEDAYGLLGEYHFATGVQRAGETLALVRQGIVSGISIGYLVPSDGYTFKNGNRIVTAVDL